MLSSRKVWLGFVAVIAALATSLAGAQDFPTQGGDNARTGKNNNPVLYGPGIANIVWFGPNGVGRPGTLLRDNNSIATVRTPNNASWTVPQLFEEAAYFYLPSRNHLSTANANIDNTVGGKNFDVIRGGPEPSYEYAKSTPSSLGSHNDPTTAPANLQTFTWTIDPTVEHPPTSPDNNYQLYVWLPNGPTGPIGGPGGALYYPNRYYVYEILYGNNQRWIDVVDTNYAGQGWVRLGNGGKSTNMVFNYINGGQPITIRLYNTEWRDQFDNILEDNTVQRVVYADAVMAVPDNGAITAGPTVKNVTDGITTRTQVVSATNHTSTSVVNGVQTTIMSPEVACFQYDGTGPALNAPFWKWSPLDVSPFTTILDNQDSQFDALWTTSNVTNHFGPDYLKATLQNDPMAADAATYKPTLDDGDYVVQVYCGGNGGTEAFGNQVTIFVSEGANPPSVYQVDQSVAGWVTIGNRRFKHRGTIGEPLRVSISNYSPLPGDTGKLAYADEVKFIGSFNESINATPVQTRAFVKQSNGATVEKDVVIVAADDGHVYCLDAIGNGNGTTTLYWAYPSILPNGAPITQDPNVNIGLDGDGVSIRSQMPETGFGQSAPLVQRLGAGPSAHDYCYVAAANGRIYCIDMEGRGDYNTNTGKVGTTTRMWTYPNDYPAIRQNAITGGFGGSLAFAFAVGAAGSPTIYVPAIEGRMYALDASVGGPNRTTTARWTYPARTTQNLGPITTTPTVDFGRVYFGTSRLSDSVPGQFYALDMATGALNWVFEGDPAGVEADNFLGGPCTATSAQLGPGNPNMVFCSNQNLFVYGLDADTGAIVWQTAELNSGVTAPLMFNFLAAFDNTGNRVAAPLVMVPTQDGRFDGLFARGADINLDGLKQAWEYVSGSDSITASMANGWNFMYGGDMAGNLFAWGNTGTIGGMGSPPGGETVTVNNPIAQEFRQAKVRLLSRDGYQLLRQSDPGDATGDTGTADYTTVINNNVNNPYLRRINAFEWGETAYVIVYDFPFKDQQPDGTPITPPIVQFQIGVEGASVRQYGVQSKKWKSGAPTVTIAGSPVTLNGYAILAFPIQGSGPTSIPPGNATIKFSFSSSASNNVGNVQNIAVAGSMTIAIANPLGIIMQNPNTGAQGSGLYTFGTNTDPSTAERLRNGSPNMPSGTPGSRLALTTGVVGHGQTGVGTFWVVDMSMLTLLKGPNRSLEQVRVTRPELAWQGGGPAVYKPINALMYPGFEDLPIEFPNHSIDYPNIDPAAVRGVKDPAGISENTLVSSNGVSLVPPAPYDENNIPNRTTHPVLFELDIDVPRFQPANNDQSRYFPDSAGNSLASGYLARFSVFVDSNGNSVLDSISGRREAYRAFTVNTAVGVDDRLSVTTPSVDLGTLAQGTGFSPLPPGTNNGTSMSPWDNTGSVVYPAGLITTAVPDFVNLFKPFRVENPGNVNELNVRVAKGVVGGPAPGPWPIYSNSVDDLGWLDSSEYLWTNFDFMYGLMPKILLQKARVGDAIPTELSTNPQKRFNQNLGQLADYLFPNGPIGAAAQPRVAVSIPIGFPVGLYSQKIEVVEDLIPRNFIAQGNQAIDVDANNNPLEVISNPSFELKFGVREFRASGGFSLATAPMIDPTPAASLQQWTTTQPTGMRTPDGALVAAFTSSRTTFGAPPPSGPITDPAYRIFFATLAGQTPQASNGSSPLKDLEWFSPATASRWFRQEVGPFPAGAIGSFGTLFQQGANETVIQGSEKFGAPAMPSTGLIDPLGGSNFSSTEMAFLGQAEKQINNAGRTTEYRIMAARVAVSASGAATVNGLISMPFDPNTPKGRPSIYQTTNGSVIFYSATGTGEGQLFWTATDGNEFSKPTVFPVGSGFEEVSAPSVQLRPYTGAGGPARPIVELSFVGKLHGRPNQEVFYGRMLTGSTQVGATNVANTPGTTLYLTPRVGEIMNPSTEARMYIAQGVAWNARLPIHVYQRYNGVVTDLEVNAGARVVDRASGIIHTDCKLGGQMSIDPNLGTVTFTSSVPLNKATILLDYTPRFIRVSESNVAGHAAPTVLWDNRIAGDVSPYSYWFNVNAGGTVSNVPPSATPRSARYVYTYTRAAAGAGNAARPYWKTLRIGVQLPTAIYTDAGGNVTGLNITGATGPVQVDPALGRIYFQSDDEDRNVSITYNGVDEGTGGPILVNNPAGGYNVGLIVERSEGAVPINQAVNESAMSPFLDPFDNNPRRPGLIWMYYVSTRAGEPDLYFQTMAPRFTPTFNGK